MDRWVDELLVDGYMGGKVTVGWADGWMSYYWMS
jgi:hypothetical protein